MTTTHFKVSYATTACRYYVGQSAMTTDRDKVTCGTCKRTFAFRGQVACDNEDAHPRAVAAIAELTWPDKRFNPMRACPGCMRMVVRGSIGGEHGTVHAVLVSPLGSAS